MSVLAPFKIEGNPNPLDISRNTANIQTDTTETYSFEKPINAVMDSKYRKFGCKLEPLNVFADFNQRQEHLAGLGYETSTLAEMAEVLKGDKIADEDWVTLEGNWRNGWFEQLFSMRTQRHSFYGLNGKTDTMEAICNLRHRRSFFARIYESKLGASNYKKPKLQGVRSCDFSELQVPPPESVLDKLNEVLDANIFHGVFVLAPDESLKVNCIDTSINCKNRNREDFQAEKLRKWILKDPILVGFIHNSETKERKYYPILRWL